MAAAGIPREHRAGSGEANERESAKRLPPDAPHGETNGPPSRRPGYPRQWRVPFPRPAGQPRLRQLKLPFEQI